MDSSQFVKVIKASLLAFICLLLALFFVNMVRITSLSQQFTNKTNDLNALNSAIVENEQISDYLKSNEFVEKEARENHGLVNEGDKVFSAE